MCRAGLESILGLRRQGATFIIDPCIPASWLGYEITWRFRSTRYEINVSNPSHRTHGVAETKLDDIVVDASAIPLVDDGGIHRVTAVLGDAPSADRGPDVPPTFVHQVMRQQ
jgi:cyclic beta-1,2-glucan synthetase